MTPKQLNSHEIWVAEKNMANDGLLMVYNLVNNATSPPPIIITTDHINLLVKVNGKLDKIVKLLKGEDTS